MVHVCDAIMGTGKSSAAITYMNEHPEQKFIYITPYLEEATRIRKSCPAMHFVEPSNKLEKYKYKKSLHTAALIREGRNIATTHQAFSGYTQSTLDLVREQGYTLIIDENVEILKQYAMHPDDVKLAEDAGLIRIEDGVYRATGKPYSGIAMRELISTIQSRELIPIKDEDSNSFFYWALPPELITSFQNAFVLTYLFEGQSLHHLFEIYGIPYSYIGVHKDDDGTFRFGELPGYTPEYVSRLGEMIHILDNQKLNAIGDDYYALSKSWFDRGDECVAQLKNNVYNCFCNIWRDVPAERKLWGTFNCAFGKLKGKGYTKGFLNFNAKATNAYRDRDTLVYAVNVFMNANECQFYKKRGVNADRDLYALSILVQWLWRSAIRDGKEIQIYIPSKRMRTLLIDWINSFSKGGDANV